jgi:hypothetical protein
VANLSVDLGHKWAFNAGWNYYQYGEGSFGTDGTDGGQTGRSPLFRALPRYSLVRSRYGYLIGQAQHRQGRSVVRNSVTLVILCPQK